jgi:predicted  nucleic acid-binding Zn-ribbon protein
MDLESIKTFVYIISALVGLVIPFIAIIYKRLNEDNKVLFQRLNDQGDRHTALKDDVQKNYVTYERMTNHIDNQFSQISDRLSRFEDKIDRYMER